MGSLIEQLSSKAVNCGLCLPRSKAFTALNLAPQQRSAGELLYYLAGYDCLKEPVCDKEGRPTGEYEPSAFVLPELARAAMEAGTIGLVTNRPADISPRLLERLERSRLILISSGGLDCPDKEIRLMHISSLRKGEGV